MSVQVARMANGEDVIADIKEVRNSEGDDARVLAYEFIDSFSIQLEMNDQEFLVEEAGKENPLGNLRMRFYPFFPLTVGSNFISLQHVVSIADPHWEVLKRYEEALQTIKKSRKDDVKVDYSEIPPSGLVIG